MVLPFATFGYVFWNQVLFVLVISINVNRNVGIHFFEFGDLIDG
jgi:hypothetical protein